MLEFDAGKALSEPNQSHHLGLDTGNFWLWIPKPKGHFSLFPFLSCSLSRIP